MSDGERLRAFWKRFDHEPDDEIEFEKFRERTMQAAAYIWNSYIRMYPKLVERFSFVSGKSQSFASTFDRSPLHGLLLEAKNPMDVFQAIKYVLMTVEQGHRSDVVQHVVERFNAVFDLSPTIRVKALCHGGIATLYPTGAKLLDEEVIDANLMWLERYPKVLKPFVEALHAYSQKDVGKYRNILDNLRRAMEEMIRVVLNNTKSLENQKVEFLQWLTKNDAHTQIRNMFHDLLFNKFATYQNEAVKHHEDDYTSAEVEFLLYLTGTFLRFVQAVSDSAESQRS
jgi:hypothetical protein